MVELVCSHKVMEKLQPQLAKHQIEIRTDSPLALVERGFELPIDKLCIVFEALDYMDVVQLLVSGIHTTPHYLSAITGLSNNRFAVLEPHDVLYLEAGADGIQACTTAGRYSVKETLHYYESLWASRGFVRINKSQLVNLLQVKEIIPWFNSRYVLRMDHAVELEVSKMYAKKLRHTLNL